MAGYKIRGTKKDGSIVEVPLAAKYDDAGNPITGTYARTAGVYNDFTSGNSLYAINIPIASKTKIGGARIYEDESGHVRINTTSDGGEVPPVDPPDMAIGSIFFEQI